MAARSVTITLVNTTNQQLALINTALAHGTWQTPPPAVIAPNAQASWEAVSDGFATGVQGTVAYQIGSGSTSAGAGAPPPSSQPPSVTLNFDNPYMGSDVFSAPTSAGYNCAVTSNSGNDAQVTYTLTAS